MHGERTPRQLPDWIADHMQRSLDTDGKEGHISRGVPSLLLTTTDRRSGHPLMLPLMDALDGDRSVMVTSQGRQKHHPGWSPTLVRALTVEGHVAVERFPARARPATADERAGLW